MKNKLLLFCVPWCASLTAFFLLANSSFSASLTVTPTVITNDYQGNVVITIGGLSPGKPAIIERFNDRNANGTIDVGNDALEQRFSATDGFTPRIGGVRNLNVPGDEDGAANGQIQMVLPFPWVDTVLHNAAGHYVFRITDPDLAFAAVSTQFEIKPRVLPQAVVGRITAIDTGAPVANALVVITTQDGPAAGATRTDINGRYTNYCQAGSYVIIPLTAGYVANSSAGIVTASSNQFVTRDLALTRASLTLSGSITDSSNATGLGGLFVIAESTTGLYAGACTDGTGKYQFFVTPGQWRVRPLQEQCTQVGYVAPESRIPVLVTSSSVSNINFSLPKPTALIYGEVRDDAGQPVLNLGVASRDLASTYEVDGRTYAPNAAYCTAVLPGQWTLEPNDEELLAYDLEGEDVTVTVSAGQAVNQNLIVRRISGPPPALSSSSPANGATGVPVNSGISFTFDRPMAPGHLIWFSDNAPSIRSFIWSADQCTFTVVFATLLPPLSEISWTLNPWSDLELFCDLAGTPLPLQSYSGTFRTADSTNLVDVEYCALAKIQSFLQTNASTLVPFAQQPFTFAATVKPRLPYLVDSVTVRVPGHDTQVLTYIADGNLLHNEEWQRLGTFTSLIEMDAAYPAGSYVFSILTAHDGARSMPIDLPATGYPNTPRIINYTATQVIDSLKDFTVSWDPFVGGTSRDIIQLVVAETEDGPIVFDSSNTGTAPRLNGTNTSVAIPAYTLPGGRSYYAAVKFEKLTITTHTNYPGVWGLTILEKESRFMLRTTTQPLSLIVAPGTITNDYPGKLAMTVAGLNAGESVRVTKYLDVNRNGVVDASEPLVQAFSLTDGYADEIGGQRNINVPGDEDGSANGMIQAQLSYANQSEVNLGIAQYIYRVTSPNNRFAPLTATLNVLPTTTAQKVTGRVTSSGSPVPAAFVFLFKDSSSRPMASTVSDASGNFTLPSLVGTYGIAALKVGYVFNFDDPPVITLNSNATVTQNLTLSAATRTISGQVIDKATGEPLAGIQVFAKGNNSSGHATLVLTDTDGFATIPVSTAANEWELSFTDGDASLRGYVVPDEGYAVNTSAGDVSGLIAPWTKANALVYGRLLSDSSQPITGVHIDADDNNEDYYGSGGFTDTDGNFAIGLLAGNWWIGPDNDDLAAQGFVRTSGITATLSSGQAFQCNLTAQRITAHLIGRVVDSTGGAIADASFEASNWDQGGYRDVTTSVNGSFDLGLFGGTWHLRLDSDDANERSLIAPAIEITIADGESRSNFVYVAQRPTAFLNGTVRLEDGTPLDGINLHATSNLGATNYDVYARTDTTGAFRMGVFNGNWEVMLDSWSLSTHCAGMTNNQIVTITGANGIVQFTVPRFRVITTSLPGGVRGAYYECQLEAVNTGSGLSWSLAPESAPLPGGLTLSTWGYVSGILEEGGTHTFTVRATSGACTADQQLTLAIQANQAPTLSAVANRSLNEGELLQFTCTATDPDAGDTLSFSLDPGTPDGAYVDPTTGVFTWTPSEAQGPGTYTISVRVTDHAGLSDAKSFTATVREVNTPPTLMPIDNQIVVLGHTLIVSNVVNDSDLPVNSLSFSLAPGAPSGASVNPSTGIFTWTPSAAQVPSTNRVTLQVSDGLAQVSQAFSVVALLDQFPDLSVTNIIVPATALTEMQMELSWTVINGGQTSANGSWYDSVYYSTNGLLEGALRVGSFLHQGPLPAKASYSHTEQVTAPPWPGQVWVFITTDAGFFIDEYNMEGNNTLRSSRTVDVSTFRASVSTDVQLASAGTPIPIVVRTFNPTTSQSMGNLPVTIRILHDNSRRVISVYTDENGAVTYLFRPLSDEGGDYAIAADRPSVADDVIQDRFTLVGMRFEPRLVQHQLLIGQSLTNQVILTNLTSVPLTGLAATHTPTNYEVRVSMGQSLAGHSQIPVTYIVRATNFTEDIITVRIVVASTEGATATLELETSTIQSPSHLVISPALLASSMLRGSLTMLAFEVRNQGAVPETNLQILLPTAPWLKLTTPAKIDRLDLGESVRPTLSLLPSSDLALGPIQGQLIVSSSRTNIPVPFLFNCVSDKSGTLRVTVVDEMTYYAAGAPKVTNASVMLNDPMTGTNLFTGHTDVTGSWTLTNLTEATYDLVVRADGHQEYHAPVTVKAGQTNDVLVFVQKQTVTYTWTVSPTEIEDHYLFRLITTFETHVPAPVITIEPASIDLDSILENVTETNFVVRNHGFIAARNVRIGGAQNGDWDVIPLATELDELPAKSTVVVPVTIVRKAALQPVEHRSLAPAGPTRTQSGCYDLQVVVTGTYPCGGTDRSCAAYCYLYVARPEFCYSSGVGGVGGGPSIGGLSPPSIMPVSCSCLTTISGPSEIMMGASESYVGAGMPGDGTFEWSVSDSKILKLENTEGGTAVVTAMDMGQAQLVLKYYPPNNAVGCAFVHYITAKPPVVAFGPIVRQTDISQPSIPMDIPFPIQVDVLPSSFSSGNQQIELKIVNTSAQNGKAEIIGSSKINQSAKVELRGTAQTEPGHSGQLKIQALYNGIVLGESQGFSVCIHPLAIRFQYVPDNHIYEDKDTHEKTWGISYAYFLRIDSTDKHDVTGLATKEIVRRIHATGYFRNSPLRVSDWIQHRNNSPPQVDEHSIGPAINAFFMGLAIKEDELVSQSHSILDQYFVFSCSRCNTPRTDTAPKIRNSGFRITQRITHSSYIDILHTKKEPYPTSGVSAGIIDNSSEIPVEIRDKVQ